MAGVRLILLYPRPADTEKFEKDFGVHPGRSHTAADDRQDSKRSSLESARR